MSVILDPNGEPVNQETVSVKDDLMNILLRWRNNEEAANINTGINWCSNMAGMRRDEWCKQVILQELKKVAEYINEQRAQQAAAAKEGQADGGEAGDVQPETVSETEQSSGHVDSDGREDSASVDGSAT